MLIVPLVRNFQLVDVKNPQTLTFSLINLLAFRLITKSEAKTGTAGCAVLAKKISQNTKKCCYRFSNETTVLQGFDINHSLTEVLKKSSFEFFSDTTYQKFLTAAKT